MYIGMLTYPCLRISSWKYMHTLTCSHKHAYYTSTHTHAYANIHAPTHKFTHTYERSHSLNTPTHT